jgi:hypothetical protein
MNTEQDRKTSIVRHTGKELVKVENDRQKRGKILVYVAPNETEKLDIFHVGISWDSLNKLAEGALCNIFFWEVTDGSLRIRGRHTQWHLLFANRRTGSSFEVSLSEDETESLKRMLFDDQH